MSEQQHPGLRHLAQWSPGQSFVAPESEAFRQDSTASPGEGKLPPVAPKAEAASWSPKPNYSGQE